MTDRINWEVVWPEVDDLIAIDHLTRRPFVTPHMLAEWSKGGRFYRCGVLQDEVDHRFMEALDRKRRLWHGQNYFNWARDPANRREEKG